VRVGQTLLTAAILNRAINARNPMPNGGTHETRRLGLDRDAVLDGAERRRERDIETADPGRYSRAGEGCNPERAAEPNRDRRNWAECPDADLIPRLQTPINRAVGHAVLGCDSFAT
jgi:hypothetical protein